LDLDPSSVRTNILMVGIGRTGLDSEKLGVLLKAEGVFISSLDASQIRLVTHKDVNRAQIVQAAEIFKKILSRN
jgi:threonine aldolase